MEYLTTIPPDDPRCELVKMIGGGKGTSKKILKIVFAEIMTDLGHQYADYDLKKQVWKKVSLEKIKILTEFYYIVTSNCVSESDAIKKLKEFEKVGKTSELVYEGQTPFITSLMFEQANSMKDEWTSEIQHAWDQVGHHF